MSDPLLKTVTTHESNGTYWAVLQRWVKQACINASITIPMSDPLLRDLTTCDSEGTRFAVLQRWLALLANNIGSGTTSLQSGSVDIVAGQQAYPIVFATPFSAPPTILPAPVVIMPDSNGEVMDVAYDLSTLTANGVTAYLGGIPTALSSGGKIYWSAAA